jgi:hypothetical protein
MSNLTAIIDADVIKYAAAFVGQKNGIVVTHPTIGVEKAFNNRTEFYGHHAKKAGGWLAEYNQDRDSPLLPSEFTIEETVDPEPIENVLHTCKMMYKSMHECIKATKHKGFIGKGDSFRVERSTLLKYKGTRPMTKPVHLDAVFDYLENRLKCEVIEVEETDERVVQECYKKPHCVATGEDKDYYGQPVRLFNINRPEEGIIDCTGFGKLWLDDKGDVRGYGRMWLYFQTLSKDDIDNYAANCFSDVRWGPKSAYKLLSPCLDDKEALQSLVGGFKTLYPEPKTVIGWREQPIDIDWLYVAQECFTMARMRRIRGEPEVMLTDVFQRLGVDYE